MCVDDALAADKVAARLGELVDHALVVVERGEGGARYRLLKTLRTYGQARLAEHAAVATWSRRHADCYLALAQQAATGVVDPEEARWVAICDVELANLRAAHRWSLTSGDGDVALRLPVVLHDYAYYRREEVFRWAEDAVGLSTAAQHPAYGLALAAAAAGCVHRGELDRAARFTKEVWESPASADQVARLRTLEVEADIALYRGQLDAQALDRPFDEAIGHLHAVSAPEWCSVLLRRPPSLCDSESQARCRGCTFGERGHRPH